VGTWSGYACSSCGARYPRSATSARYACDRCGDEALDIEMELDGLVRSGLHERRSLWRYEPLLPVACPPDDAGPLASLGMTPLHLAPRCATRAGARAVWIKDDGALPTGSLKDRASAIVAMRARELGVEKLIAASTGNAGVAMAAMARAAGLAAVVLVPESAPPAKIAQLLVFGATLQLVRGSYDDAFALSRRASQELGWYCRNTAYNPFTVEGKKTVAFEICEALGWRAPAVIYVSVGDGNILTGVHKGLKELVALGWIARMPRLVGVQAAGSAAIARAHAAKTEGIEPVRAATVADSIAADRPADGRRARRAIDQSGGHFTVVEDDAILRAIALLGLDASVFAEPAAAAAYAGLLDDAERGLVGAEDEVVVLVTGNGLKDVAAAVKATSRPEPIAPDLDALRRALRA
jgi:threonine synthase